MRQDSNSIFSDKPELASDLEWMLQSGQAAPAALAAELARTYFQDLQRWMALLLDDPEQADFLSLKAIMAAAQSAYRFPGGISSRVWVFKQAVSLARRALRTSRWKKRWKTALRPGHQLEGYSLPATYQDAALWIAVDRLSDESRMAACLAWGLSLELATIAHILDQPELEIDRMLALGTRSVLNSLAAFELKLDDLPEQALDLTIRESLARRTAQLQSEPLDIEILANEISAEIDHQVGCHSILTRLKEFTLLGLVAVVFLGVFWIVNVLLPEDLPAGLAAGGPSTISADIQADSPYEVLRLDYYAQPGETVDEIGKALGLQAAEMAQLRSTYSDGHLDLASPLRIGLEAPRQFPASTPVAPVAHRQAPLSVESSPIEIRNLMSTSQTMWSTLWLDAVIFDYGPDGYVGSPHQYRIQSWYSQPDLNLMITWTSGSDNTYAILRKDGIRFTRYHQGWLDVRRDGPGSPDSDLTEEMVFPSRSQIFSRPGQMRVVGEDFVAGRQTIVVDWHTDVKTIWPDRYRMWVDVQTGMVLRFQFYSGQEGDTLLGEVIFAKLALDVDFPQADLFTPWNLQEQVFVSDYRGEQVDASVLPVETLTAVEPQSVQARRPPPTDFDPSTSQLQFQYQLSLQPSNKPSTVEVFADQFYLGDLQLSDPWSVYCFRSPDGRKVAYSFNPYGGPLVGSGWFELKNPLEVRTGSIKPLYGIFAFAPDSRQLAFFGRDSFTSPSSLILIDTETGQERLLGHFHNVASMYWKPDGSQIAILAAPDDGWSRLDAVILDAANGDELYRVEVDPNEFWDPASRASDWPAVDWPGRDWGETFPQIQQGLSSCASPPP